LPLSDKSPPKPVISSPLLSNLLYNTSCSLNTFPKPSSNFTARKPQRGWKACRSAWRPASGAGTQAGRPQPRAADRDGGTGPFPIHLVERAEGLFADLLASSPEPVLPHPESVYERRTRQTAEVLGADPQTILAWGFTECMLSAWWSYEDHGHGGEELPLRQGSLLCGQLHPVIHLHSSQPVV